MHNNQLTLNIFSVNKTMVHGVKVSIIYTALRKAPDR